MKKVLTIAVFIACACCAFAGVWKPIFKFPDGKIINDFVVKSESDWYVAASQSSYDIATGKIQISSGVYHTTNKGISWDSSIVFSSNKPSDDGITVTGLIITDDYWMCFLTTGEVKISEDAGKNWNKNYKPTTYPVTMYSIGSSRFVVIYDGINLFTSNVSLSFENIVLPTEINQRKITSINSLQCLGDSTIYLTCSVHNDSLSRYLLKSKNRGLNWSFYPIADSVSGAISFYDVNRGVVGGSFKDKTGYSKSKYFITDDGGLTFKKIFEDYGDNLYVNYSNDGKIFIGCFSFFHSFDKGKTFTLDSLVMPPDNQQALNKFIKYKNEVYTFGMFNIYQYQEVSAVEENNSYIGDDIVIPNPIKQGNIVKIKMNLKESIQNLNLTDQLGKMIEITDYSIRDGYISFIVPKVNTNGVYLLNIIGDKSIQRTKMIVAGE